MSFMSSKPVCIHEAAFAFPSAPDTWQSYSLLRLCGI